LAHVRSEIKRQARPLLQADVAVRSKLPLTPSQSQLIGIEVPAGGRQQTVIQFATMAYAPSTGRSQLVNLTAVEPGYPFYGEIQISDGPFNRIFSDAPGILVPPELLTALHLKTGDYIRIGKIQFMIVGVIRKDPGSAGNPFGIGPRVLIGLNQIAATELIGLGARVTYTQLIALPDPELSESVSTQIRQRLGIQSRPARFQSGFGPSAPIEVRSLSDIQGQLQSAVSRFGDYMILVSLAAMGLAGIAIFYLITAILQQSAESLAVLRTLGYSAGQLIRAYLFMAVCVSLLGTVGGILGGAAVGFGFPVLFRGLIPAEAGILLTPEIAITATLIAVVTTLYFALWAILPIRDIKPALMLREGLTPRSGLKWDRVALAIAGASVFAGISILRAHSIPIGLGFSGAVFGAGLFIVLAVTFLFLPAVRSMRRRIPSFTISYALANLSRPFLGIPTLMLTIGLSSFLIGIIMVYQASLRSEFLPSQTALPQFFLIDIQPDQTDSVSRLVRSYGGELTASPIVRARLRNINRPTGGNFLQGRTDAEIAETYRTREQNLSYRNQLGANETITDGKWITGDQEISVESDFARRLGIGLGSVLTFDVQGVTVTGSVTSIRTVKWNSFTPTFFILLSPALIAGAPTTYVGSVSGLSESERLNFQSRLTTGFPNVTSVNIRETVEQVLQVVNRIARAIAGIAGFTFAVGLLAIIGVAIATARQRKIETALLKTLGADQRSILILTALEFGMIGGIAAMAGTGAAALTGWILLHQIFDLAIVIPLVRFGTLIAAVIFATALTGTVTAGQAIRAKAADVFRDY
ncbi:FtsX-like permease family protein, partial [bacterium]|nr:FtsX-like permease family protein [bacterium]